MVSARDSSKPPKTNAGPKLPAAVSKALRAVEETAYYERGQNYADEGRVGDIFERDGITATVHGTRAYTVRLWMEGRRLRYHCTCPIGLADEFCKHCIAVALQWSARGATENESPSHRDDMADGEGLRAHVRALERKDLEQLVLRSAEKDNRVRREILRSAGDVSNYALAWKKDLKVATYPHGFVEWRYMPDFARGISEVVEELAEWLSSDRAAEAVALAEYAAERVGKAIELSDDSDGLLGGVLHRVAELHLAACKEARPEPKRLAKRLFELELHEEWETFLDSYDRYWSVLGNEGRKVYETLAEKRWAKIPPLRPGDNEDAGYRGDRFRITRIMESIARRKGSVDDLVEVMSRDLSSAYHFLEIAERIRKAGRADDALTWAERGLGAFPKNTDDRVRSFVIKEYLSRGRVDEAVHLAWRNFEDSPSESDYKTLHSIAERGKQWPTWKRKAFENLRNRASRDIYSKSLLVKLHLLEGEIEEAWNAGGNAALEEGVRLALAAARGRTHPEDAVRLYREAIDETLRIADNRSYQYAVQLLRRIRPVLNRSAGAGAWVKFLEYLRTKHRAKRNLMKLLDQL